MADPPDSGADPIFIVEGPRPSRTYLALRQLVIVMIGLNLIVLALLAAVTVVRGGDDSSSVAASGSTEAVAPADSLAPDAQTAEPEVAGPDLDREPTNAGDPADDGETEPSPSSTLDGTPTDAANVPPYPEPFEPTVNEVQPDAKRLGALMAYRITNYDAGATIDDVIATLPAGAAQIEGLKDEVMLVHHPDRWSRGTVEYVQLGGHLDGRISNIVVIRQDIGVAGSSEPERTETRVMEVRLARNTADAWALETIASAGGAPIDRPADLSEAAAAVVDHDRIELPDTAVWDIYRGYIDRQLLRVMREIADRGSYSVVVLQTGHSYNVFGTERVSNHSVGRAVDIYEFESELVIDSHATSSDFYGLSEWIVSRYDIREFGSPWRFPDAVAHTFTNEVHHDHLHIGVHPYPASPDPPPTTTVDVATEDS